MKRCLLLLMAACMVLIFDGCSSTTYTPRSKKNKHREMPSILLYERIIDFRIEQNSWPLSKEDFMSKGRKYYEVMRDFKYQTVRFKTIDRNTMVFDFSEHIKDVENFERTQQVDLNSYGGRVKFSKENGKFVWKINRR